MAPNSSPAWLVLLVAAMAAVFSLVPALWLAWLAQTRPSRAAAPFANAALALPPAIVCGYFLFRSWGIPFDWPYAVMAGMVNAVPILLRTAMAAFGALAPEYENAARSVGLSEGGIFRRIAFPLARTPILTATAVVFARTLTEYALVVFIARRHAS
jgi:molybdate transport system permease protein